MREIITKSSDETKKTGLDFSKGLQGGEVICLSGELGAGKTTFTQGLLEGLGAKGPYTSPTFVIMKKYSLSRIMNHESPSKNQLIRNVYHFDAYRVGSRDIIDLGWEEIISDKNNVVIVEWAERIEDVIPSRAWWIRFRGVDENRRKIIFKSPRYKIPACRQAGNNQTNFKYSITNN